MVRDGVNDARALVRAKISMAMAAAGMSIVTWAALALILEDRTLVPEVIRVARRS